jgi:hypothetical protein
VLVLGDQLDPGLVPARDHPLRLGPLLALPRQVQAAAPHVDLARRQLLQRRERVRVRDHVRIGLDVHAVLVVAQELADVRPQPAVVHADDQPRQRLVAQVVRHLADLQRHVEVAHVVLVHERDRVRVGEPGQAHGLGGDLVLAEDLEFAVDLGFAADLLALAAGAVGEDGGDVEGVALDEVLDEPEGQSVVADHDDAALGGLVVVAGMPGVHASILRTVRKRLRPEDPGNVQGLRESRARSLSTSAW